MERTRLDVYEKLPSGMEKYLAEHGGTSLRNYVNMPFPK